MLNHREYQVNVSYSCNSLPQNILSYLASYSPDNLLSSMTVLFSIIHSLYCQFSIILQLFMKFIENLLYPVTLKTDENSKTKKKIDKSVRSFRVENKFTLL